jgi:hypothetical protein
MITSNDVVDNATAGTPSLSKLDQTRMASAPSANISGITIPRADVMRWPTTAASRRGSHAAHAASTADPYHSGLNQALS